MKSPLSTKDLSDCRKCLYEISSTEQGLEAAEMAGLDVTELRARLVHAKGSLQAILDTYGSEPKPKGD